MSVLSAVDVRKRYGDVAALDGFDLDVGEGRIVGLIGPNGSGKTTALNALLGLNQIDSGTMEVLGLDPQRERAALMEQVAYIADTGILPKWMRVRDLLAYARDVHPHFHMDAALERLSRTDVRLDKKVRVLSKGMHVQLHLAIILAIDARLLVLDEPTLGLDIIYRQNFYDAVLNDYFHDQRSILVTTHEVREIEHILTDVVFIHRGRARLAVATADIPERFVKLTAAQNVALPTEPLSKRKTLAGMEFIFADTPRESLAELGELSTPNVPELFVAIVEHDHV